MEHALDVNTVKQELEDENYEANYIIPDHWGNSAFNNIKLEEFVCTEETEATELDIGPVKIEEAVTVEIKETGEKTVHSMQSTNKNIENLGAHRRFTVMPPIRRRRSNLGRRTRNARNQANFQLKRTARK